MLNDTCAVFSDTCAVFSDADLIWPDLHLDLCKAWVPYLYGTFVIPSEVLRQFVFTAVPNIASAADRAEAALTHALLAVWILHDMLGG